nr:hypothetical protein [uncultured Campylobacter sp.]
MNRLNLKFAAQLLSPSQVALVLAVFKILNLPAHPIFQLVYKRGYIIINRTLPLLLV